MSTITIYAVGTLLGCIALLSWWLSVREKSSAISRLAKAEQDIKDIQGLLLKQAISDQLEGK